MVTQVKIEFNQTRLSAAFLAFYRSIHWHVTVFCVRHISVTSNAAKNVWFEQRRVEIPAILKPKKSAVDYLSLLLESAFEQNAANFSALEVELKTFLSQAPCKVHSFVF